MARDTAMDVPIANPIIRDKFTADPAPLVVGDTLYLYVGHDEAQRDEMFNMREWLVYSTKDMRTWTDHGAIMRVAVWELLYADDVPGPVAVDEAVQLAKELSTDDSPGFVNGVLGQLMLVTPQIRAAAAAVRSAQAGD